MSATLCPSAPTMSFGTADDLTAMSLALMQAANELRAAVRHADRLLLARELAESEALDLHAARQTLDALPRLLAGLSRPLDHLFAEAESVGEASQVTVEPENYDLPF